MRYFIALFGLLLWPTLTWAAAGQVESASGQVWDARGQQTLALAAGSEVQADDIIRTGKAGQVRLVMHDNSVVFLGPRSRMRIERYDTDQRGLLAGAFYLLRGKARFLVNKLKREAASFTVSTQTANIGVRGTEFGVIVPDPDPNGRSAYTDVLLFKGAVIGRGVHGSIVVMKPGQFVHFTASGMMQERTITPQDVRRLGIQALAPRLIGPEAVHSQPKSVKPSLSEPPAPGGLAHRPQLPPAAPPAQLPPAAPPAQLPPAVPPAQLPPAAPPAQLPPAVPPAKP